MNELALFAGAGGGILGGKLLGWKTVCAVEWEPYPASVLVARQNDKVLSPFPIWDDVQTFDGKPWRGIVDVVSGGFPCQDISAAGKGTGIDGERSGMWREMARVICEVEPRFVFVENSPMLTSRGLGRVLGDLASMGFDAAWGVLGAADVGANHQRDRIWIVAERGGYVSYTQHDRIRRWKQQQEGVEKQDGDVPDSSIDRRWNGKIQHVSRERQQATNIGDDGKEKFVADFYCQRQQQQYVTAFTDKSRQPSWQFIEIGDVHWWEVEPNVGRVADGVDARVDRLKAIGNGQVPLCAATAWKILSKNVIDARLGRY